MERRHFINFDIAGFTYWDGTLAFQELIIGTKLQLRREEDNKMDHWHPLILLCGIDRLCSYQ